jgi:hypothetical protein
MLGEDRDTDITWIPELLERVGQKIGRESLVKILNTCMREGQAHVSGLHMG